MRVSILAALLVACSDDPEPAEPRTTEAPSTPDEPATPDEPSTGETPPALLWAEGCDPGTPEEAMVDVGELDLHVICQGAGETLVMLHGFPEFWRAWRPVMDTLAASHRLIVPDQRGYNLSDKPPEVGDYIADGLAADIAGLIDAVSDAPVTLVGHDWGGAIAWLVAHRYPDRIGKLVILNAAHPDVFAWQLEHNPAQQEASSYFDNFLQDGWEEELAKDDFARLSSNLGQLISAEELALYKEAWGQPNALVSQLNWYRANLDEDGMPTFADDLTIPMPTLVLWGMLDQGMLPANLVGLDRYVEDLTIVTFDDAGHFVTHQEPAAVASEILAF